MRGGDRFREKVVGRSVEESGCDEWRRKMALTRRFTALVQKRVASGGAFAPRERDRRSEAVHGTPHESVRGLPLLKRKFQSGSGTLKKHT